MIVGNPTGSTIEEIFDSPGLDGLGVFEKSPRSHSQCIGVSVK
jgi:hypothetical protein